MIYLKDFLEQIQSMGIYSFIPIRFRKNSRSSHHTQMSSNLLKLLMRCEKDEK